MKIHKTSSFLHSHIFILRLVLKIQLMKILHFLLIMMLSTSISYAQSTEDNIPKDQAESHFQHGVELRELARNMEGGRKKGATISSAATRKSMGLSRTNTPNIRNIENSINRRNPDVIHRGRPVVIPNPVQVPPVATPARPQTPRIPIGRPNGA